MNAEELLKLVDDYGAWTTSETYQPLRDAIGKQAAERRQLAKHCVVVISQGSGFFKDVWCTVCQARKVVELNEGLKDFHRFDCLVGKVELEG